MAVRDSMQNLSHCWKGSLLNVLYFSSPDLYSIAF